MNYGNPPQLLGQFNLPFEEYMHYMYLPIAMGSEAEGVQTAIPRRLEFLKPLLDAVFFHELHVAGSGHWNYAYLTARRGYATPGNPLNRPGWHSDGFGTNDINYVWTDRFPTVFAEGEFRNISDDHLKSAQQFEAQISYEDRLQARDPHVWGEARAPRIEGKTYGDRELMRLDPSVIHAAPEIPAPGGERSFVKVSFSNDRYDLKGNSHNYGLDYEWPMLDRSATRNDPASAGADRG